MAAGKEKIKAEDSKMEVAGIEAEKIKQEPEKRERKTESHYSVEELVENAHQLFDTNKDLAMAAFRWNQKTEATLEEAKKLVTEFLQKGME